MSNSRDVLAHAESTPDNGETYVLYDLVRELADELKDAQRLLAEIRDLANTSNWQSRAATPQLFHNFLVDVLKSSNGFDEENL